MHTGCLNSLDGIPLSLNSTSFTTDSTPPRVSTTTPTNLKTSVSRTSNIVIKFSENITYSIYYNNITIKNLSTNTNVAIKKTINNNTLNIKSTTTLTANTWYEVKIPVAAIKDYVGNNLIATYTFRFKTIKL